ncbi:MAG: ketopantoate reductase family protein [Chloroflexaceae bacterium]
MKIGIIGVGALGSLLGFYLSGVAGQEVWLLGTWPAQIAAIQQNGLECERDERRERRAVRVTDDPTVIGPCALVLVLVKAHQTAQAAVRMQPLLDDSTLVITLQNGLGNREILAQALGTQRVTQGVTRLGATLTAPGRVRHAGMGSTFFAVAPTGADRLAALVDIFQAAGLPAEQHPDVEQLIWNKLIVNVGINALTALLRVPNGALAELPPARELLGHLVAEAAAVAAARGTPLPNDPLAQVLAVAAATRANHSSMLQDVLRGSPTEIAAINGAIVREGERLGIPTPYNRVITALVTALDAATASRIGSC